jgi:hypothetical protein
MLDYLVSVIIISCGLKSTDLSNAQLKCMDYFNNCAVKYNKELEKQDIEKCKKDFYKYE